ncbi:MAG: hypothetical protein AB1656_02030 [Candidatus Omnitrophota bacterium]
MKNAGFLLAIVLCAAAVYASETKDSLPQIDDIASVFANIPPDVRSIVFVKNPQYKIPEGGHLQGVQFTETAEPGQQIVFLSGSSNTKAYLVAAAFDYRRHGRMIGCTFLPSDGATPPLKHAGGFQIIGNYLAVGVEDNQDKKRSEIQFWDISNAASPIQCAYLTVKRSSDAEKIKTAGAVGITKTINGHLLAVASWDANTVDFYRSNAYPLSDERCRFEQEPFLSWKQAEANRDYWQPDKTWGRYQNINLLCDRSNNIYLMGFCKSDDREIIDLFAVEANQKQDRAIRKIAAKNMRLQNGASFMNGGGIYIKSPMEMFVLACEKNIREKTTINLAP